MGKPGSEVSPWWVPRDNHLSPHLQMDTRTPCFWMASPGPKKMSYFPGCSQLGPLDGMAAENSHAYTTEPGAEL